MSDADTSALVAMLRQIQCEPASFDTYSMASAAERAADAIETLARERDALRSALTASEKRVQELEMQSRGNWIDAEQLAAVIRHAVWEADNQAGVIDVDKLRAAMEKAHDFFP